MHEFEASCVNFVGVRQTWQVVTSPLFDDTGKVEAVLAVSKTISDRRALESAFHTLDRTLKAEREFSMGALMPARARERSLSTELHTLRDLHDRIEDDLDIARAARGAADIEPSRPTRGSDSSPTVVASRTMGMAVEKQSCPAIGRHHRPAPCQSPTPR